MTVSWSEGDRIDIPRRYIVALIIATLIAITLIGVALPSQSTDPPASLGRSVTGSATTGTTSAVPSTAWVVAEPAFLQKDHT